MLQVQCQADDGHYISVLESNRYMLDNEVACDVTFEVATPGEKVKLVRAHRYMLISRNPVFKTMFCGAMAERGDTIVVCDVLPATLHKIIKYLYCETIDITSEDIFDLIYAAKKYLINPIVQSCFDFLQKNISTNTVCAILNCALFYDEKDLIRKCLRHIALYVQEVIDSDTFDDLSKEAVQMIVESKILNIHETVLLDACIAWCKAECHRNGQEYKADRLKQYLGASFYHFRMSKLSTDFLRLRVIGSGMLDENEEEMLIDGDAAEKGHKIFLREERQQIKSGECRCVLATKSTGSVNYFNNGCFHEFTLSEDIVLHGIEVVATPWSYITGIRIVVSQDTKKLFCTLLKVPAARKEMETGTLIPLHLPKRIPLHEGEFAINLNFSSIVGNACIGTCSPPLQGVEVNGVKIKPRYTDNFHIATLLFSVI